jgi:flagellar hook-basal body protein
MGLFDALTTAVGGLQAQSFALQNISGNIANSQTTGFKETDTSFDALVSVAAAGQQTSGSVLSESVAINTVQGSIQSTAVSTNMAINGDGWFVVSPVFSGVNDYTRRGDFQENQGGYLVNGAGYYLMGIPVSPSNCLQPGDGVQAVWANASAVWSKAPRSGSTAADQSGRIRADRASAARSAICCASSRSRKYAMVFSSPSDSCIRDTQPST